MLPSVHPKVLQNRFTILKVPCAPPIHLSPILHTLTLTALLFIIVVWFFQSGKELESPEHSLFRLDSFISANAWKILLYLSTAWLIVKLYCICVFLKKKPDLLCFVRVIPPCVTFRSQQWVVQNEENWNECFQNYKGAENLEMAKHPNRKKNGTKEMRQCERSLYF